MRPTACVFLLLLPAPAMAASLCDDLAGALRRGHGATVGKDFPANILQQLAAKSGGHIRIEEQTAPVPPVYQVEGFDEPRMSRLGDGGAMAVVNTQGSLRCESWAFFGQKDGKPGRVENPPTITNEEGGGLCWDSFAQSVRIGGVPAMVTEDDGDNRVTFHATPWQGQAWGKSCRVVAAFKPRYRVDAAYCKGGSCAALQARALALVPRYLSLPAKQRETEASDARRLLLPPVLELPTFDISSTNPYRVFSAARLQDVVVHGQKLVAAMGGGMFGWREYRGNLVGFWRRDGNTMVPVAGYQIQLGNSALQSVRVTPDISRK